MIRFVVSGLAALVSILAIYSINLTTVWWQVFLVWGIWLVVLTLFYFFIYQKSSHKWLGYILLLVTIFSLLCLLFFVEWQWLYYLVLIFGGVETAFIFARLPTPGAELTHQQKPLRRGIMMLWVFNTYILLSTVFAINIYFPNFPFVVPALGGGLVVFLATLVIWKNYLLEKSRELFILAGLVALVLFELLWVLHYLSLGNFVLGALAAWIWYIVILLSRFNLMPENILWKKHFYFLIANGVLLFIFLFLIVRWF